MNSKLTVKSFHKWWILQQWLLLQSSSTEYNCHYSVQISSVLIQFSSITVSVLQSWSVMKKIQFSYKSALQKAVVYLSSMESNAGSVQWMCRYSYKFDSVINQLNRRQLIIDFMHALKHSELIFLCISLKSSVFSHGHGQFDYSALVLFLSQAEQLPLSFRALAHCNETRWPEGHPQLRKINFHS